MARPDSRRNLVPLFLVSGISIGLVPWLHPANTCQDWLVKWGQQSMHPKWIAIHELGMAGFAALAMAGAFLVIMSNRSWVSLFGGAGFCSGYLIHANVSISHATEVSYLARVYIASAANPETQKILRATAEAMLSYDDAAWKCASVLASAGGVMMMWALHREGVLSRAVAIITMILASVWALQPLGIIRLIFHTQFPEIWYWQVVPAWLFLLSYALMRRRETATSAADAPAAAIPATQS